MSGIRERKKLATRTALSDAALELAAQRGISKVTVEAIADRAGVSVRTFFNYFSAKEEAMVASHREEIRRLVEQIRQRPDDEPILESLRISAHAVVTPDDRLVRIRHLAAQLDSAPELLGYRLTAFAEIEQELTAIITERAVDGPGPDYPDGYPMVLATAVIAVTSAVLRDWRGAPAGQTLEARIDSAFALLAHGFAEPTRRGVTMDRWDR